MARCRTGDELCKRSGPCLSFVQAFRPLPELCCRHGFAWPWNSLVLTHWLDFLAWLQTCLVIIDLPNIHWTIGWTWLLSPPVILPLTLLTWLQTMCHHFGLVSWSCGPNYHYQTDSACLAQATWDCALVRRHCPQPFAVIIISLMAFPCGAAHSCCSLTYIIIQYKIRYLRTHPRTLAGCIRSCTTLCICG